ncbi:hypothetical protein B566_EDAN013967 [Ephemera danica]|nr:hypothetical protein B566_EDAN013967 [Ephemera danica]
MVKRCCIASCKNTNKTEPGRNKTYHKFPSCSDVLRKLWLQFLHDDPHSKKKGISVDSSFICSNHFSTDCYKTYTFRKTLERESIPSVYMIHGKPFFWLGHPAAVATYKASLDDIPSFPV